MIVSPFEFRTARFVRETLFTVSEIFTEEAPSELTFARVARNTFNPLDECEKVPPRISMILNTHNRDPRWNFFITIYNDERFSSETSSLTIISCFANEASN